MTPCCEFYFDFIMIYHRPCCGSSAACGWDFTCADAGDRECHPWTAEHESRMLQCLELSYGARTHRRAGVTRRHYEAK